MRRELSMRKCRSRVVNLAQFRQRKRIRGGHCVRLSQPLLWFALKTGVGLPHALGADAPIMIEASGSFMLAEGDFCDRCAVGRDLLILARRRYEPQSIPGKD